MLLRFVAVASLAVLVGALPALSGRLLNVHDDGKSASLIVYGGRLGPSRSRGQPSSDVAIVSLAVNNNSQTTKRGASMPSGRSYFGSVSINNTIYVIGGDYGQNFWSYDILTDKWTTLPDFPEQVSGTSLLQVNGTTLVATGGQSGDWWVTNAYAYDLTSGSVAHKDWQEVSSPDFVGDTAPCAVTVDAKIYFLEGGVFFRSDDTGKTWSKMPTLYHDDLDSQACAPLGDDLILFTGGGALYSTDARKDVKAFNITSNSWVNMQPMIRARTAHAAVVLPAAHNNNVLVCGGFAGDDVYDDCEIFDGKTHMWSLATDIKLDQPRFGFGLVVAETAVNA